MMMLRCWLLVSTILLLNLSHAQEPTQAPTDTATGTTSPTMLTPWSGCRDPNNPDIQDVIEIGKPMTICVTLGPGGNWAAGVRYLRYTFRPDVDEYSRFHIINCEYRLFVGMKRIVIFKNTNFSIYFNAAYEDIVNGQPQNGGDDDTGTLQGNITIHLAAQSQLSYLRVYYNPSTHRVYPFLTAIIDVHNGAVVGITWDDSCVFCESSKCEEITYNFDGESSASNPAISKSPSRGCYFQQEQCNKNSRTGGQDCDVAVYVVWSGTDVNGKVFRSSAYRFSQFPPNRLRDALVDHIPAVPNFGLDILNPFGEN